MEKGLVERIRERVARDDGRRTGDGDYLRLPPAARERDGARDQSYGILWNVMHRQALAEVEPLKPVEPLSEAAVAKIETSLGFRLPDELRQVYLEIGDGGFGPFNGIRRLSNWAKDYPKLRAELPAERGREWPESLLPIVYRNATRLCVDRTTGEVLLWTKPPKRASEKKWLESFVPQSPSVGEWLERWVDTPTEVEGGPQGGWAAPGEELERRHQVEQEKADRRAHELERARHIAHASLQPLPDELLQRLRTSAADAEDRTSYAASHSQPVDLATIEEELEAKMGGLPRESALGLVGLFSAAKRVSGFAVPGALDGIHLVQDSGSPGMVMVKRGARQKLGAPATDAALDNATRKLGFPLPRPLVQLYRIADGGFGPGDGGLLSLARLLELYAKLSVTSEDPPGKPWPAKRLPFYEAGTALGCLDLETGRVVSYEILGRDYPSSRDWSRTGEEWESLEALLEEWLGRRAFPEERARATG